MKISMIERGGWANVTLRWSVDTDQLNAHDAARLDEALSRAELASNSASQAPLRDARSIEVQVDCLDGTRTVRFDEGSTSPETANLAALVRLLANPSVVPPR
jgi:hypothetical protein